MTVPLTNNYNNVDYFLSQYQMISKAITHLHPFKPGIENHDLYHHVKAQAYSLKSLPHVILEMTYETTNA